MILSSRIKKHAILYLFIIPFSEKKSRGIRFSATPFEDFPQFFFSLIFFAPSFLMEQSLEAPKDTGIIFSTLSFAQITSQIIAHSGSIWRFSSFFGKTILSLSKGKVFKYFGIKLFSDGI